MIELPRFTGLSRDTLSELRTPTLQPSVE